LIPKRRRRPMTRLLLEHLEDRVVPSSTFVVNNTADTDDGQSYDPNGITTLRKAIRLANNNSDATIINFNLIGAATITLNQVANGPFNLSGSHSVTINGPGSASLSLDGAGAGRVFNISGGETATLSGMTIQNGSASIGTDSVGGGIEVQGIQSTLTLT